MMLLASDIFSSFGLFAASSGSDGAPIVLRIPPPDPHEQDRTFLRAIRGKSRRELLALIRTGTPEWRLEAIRRELVRATERRSA